ncbi:DUF4373 domain-containing protein [Parapedobacter soli]|uniref:DUF4373 domain-containing protein n=1 Tax=Parapedobacter soli TaxID=416955 RepID=UPI0021C5C9D2|nr:DUF4373 domain-containing protein [Parapedobacter soli]
MARPEKLGLDYFPLDVDIFESDKMLAISGEFAVKGEIITLRLLCEIYRNGYFVEYSELLKNKLARLSGLSVNLIDEVIGKLVKYGFFDESVFREHYVLTSKGIQKRYLEAVKRRKNILCEHYWLLNGVNVDINPASKGVNVDISTQKKRKESKVKNIDYVDSAGAPDGGDNDPSVPPKPPWNPPTLDEVESELLSATIWHGDFGTSLGMSDPADVPKWIAAFVRFLRGTGKQPSSISDAKTHAHHWVRKQLELGKTADSGPLAPPNQPDPSDNSWRFNKSVKPHFPGDWRWIEKLGRWVNRDNMSNTERRRCGI